jgi:hypothetical protein
VQRWLKVEEAEVTLFRAVTEDEWMSIHDSGTYTVPPGLEGKYFSSTREQALAFIDTGFAVRLTSASFPDSALELADEIYAASEGKAFYLPAALFPHGPVSLEALAESSEETP